MGSAHIDDARDGVLHNLKLKDIDSSSLCMFQQAIVRIWQKTLSEVPLEQLSNISNVFSFYTNGEIVDTLLHCKKCQDYRTVADMLYYLKEDMKYFR